MKHSDFEVACKDVARHWGTRMPMMTLEECGELVQAVCKVERAFENRPDPSNVYVDAVESLVDEMGDILIAVEALRQYYRIPQSKIDMRIESKLAQHYPAKTTFTEPANGNRIFKEEV